MVEADMAARMQDHQQHAPLSECSRIEAQYDLIKGIAKKHRHCTTLHTMLSFLVLLTLTPWQRHLMVFHSFPSFPCLKMMLAVVCMGSSASAAFELQSMTWLTNAGC
jgi:hypothetical protein